MAIDPKTKAPNPTEVITPTEPVTAIPPIEQPKIETPVEVVAPIEPATVVAPIKPTTYQFEPGAEALYNFWQLLGKKACPRCGDKLIPQANFCNAGFESGCPVIDKFV